MYVHHFPEKYISVAPFRQTRMGTSNSSEVKEIPVSVNPEDLHVGSLQVLKVLRPSWEADDVKFLVNFQSIGQL